MCWSLSGETIMAVYCVLADIGTIYERTYNATKQQKAV
ncbi:MAG: hypothetical protein ACI9C9_002810, partial [Marivirga sp.]